MMLNSSKNKTIRLNLILLDLIGENSLYTSTKQWVFRIFNVIGLFFLNSYAFLNFFHVSGVQFITAMESFVILFHIFLKYVLLLYQKKNILNILKDIDENAWNYRHFPDQVCHNWRKFYTIMNKFQWAAVIMTVMATYLLIFKPLYNEKYVLLLDTYIPDKISVSGALQFCEFYLFPMALPIVLGYDFTYLLLCLEIMLQVNLLSNKLQSVIGKNGSDILSEARYCISYHQFLITIFWRIEKLYSMVLLLHYFGTMLSSCTLIFVLLKYADSVDTAIKLNTLVFLYLQYAYYTLPADEVACKFSDVAQSLYMSKWYNTNIEVQKSLLFMTMKCQRIQYFSGVGFIDINADAYGSAVRKSFSFYAIMKNLINK